MTLSEKSVFRVTTLAAILGLAFCGTNAHADSLTLSTQFLENGVAVCSSATSGTCTGAFAQGNLATGIVGVAAEFPTGGLPLPNTSGEITVEAIASAAIVYDFASTVSSGTAVIDLAISGDSSVSNANFPSNICPSSMPCRAAASIGIGSGESFVGAAPGTTQDILANISNSGSASAPTGPIQIIVPISDGTTTLSYSLIALAECPSLSALQRSEGISCTAIADYLDPLSITGVSIYDSNGNLIPGASLTSESGFTVSSAAPTPEPSTFFLLGTGSALLGWVSPKLRGRRSKT